MTIRRFLLFTKYYYPSNSQRRTLHSSQWQKQDICRFTAAAVSCVAMTTALCTSLTTTSCDYHDKTSDDCTIDNGKVNNSGSSCLHFSQGEFYHPHHAFTKSTQQQHQDATILASSSFPSRKVDVTSKHTQRSTITHNDTTGNNIPKRIDCDYVIVGYGKAGQSAARTIERLDPTSTIVIIDPRNGHDMTQRPTSMHSHGGNGTHTNRLREAVERTQQSSNYHYYLPSSRATFIDHAHKSIHVQHDLSPSFTRSTETFGNNSSSNNANHDRTTNAEKNKNHNIHHPNKENNHPDTSILVHYRKSALLATGSRGAPPPGGCIREDASIRILELRSTRLLRRQKQKEEQREQQPAASTQSTTHTTNLPILDPGTVRSLSRMAVAQGATVAIMGSGFEALEMAAHLAQISRSSLTSLSSPSSTRQKQKDGSNRVLLLFGNSSPMNNCLPRYLGVAVTKRLRQNGIDVEDRTMTRYIAMNRPIVLPSTPTTSLFSSHNNAASGSSGEVLNPYPPPQLEIYTVKSYDHMDTKRLIADLLILAPCVDGMNGTAVVPSLSSSCSVVDNIQYLPWSSLISPPLLSCYLDDGRIAVNAELNAASTLFAAGSVARYPNRRTGRAEVLGGSHMCSKHAGEMAARNMVGSLDTEEISTSSSSSMDKSSNNIIEESIPIWRSDTITYLPEMSTESEQLSPGRYGSTPHSSFPPSLALYSMGIHALCIGRCDSECMATHGFWWTNQSSTQTDSSGNSYNNKNNGSGPNAFMRKATRRMTNSKSNRGALPVYGSGVVFYLDRSGNVEGVMLWGLPYTSNPGDALSNINTALVDRMKSVVRTNGGVSVADHSEAVLRKYPGMSLDVHLLNYLHLAEESRYLASLALSGSHLRHDGVSLDEETHRTTKVVLGRPLHRYTPIKSVELMNVGKVHRKDEAGHATEENDMFYPSLASSFGGKESNHDRLIEVSRPPSLKRIYPLMQGNIPPSDVQISSTETAERERRQLDLERSRPPKEEPLWMRHGDEHRYISKRDVWVDSFLRNIQTGRFSDGSDAVKQAPMPKIYTEMNEKWNNWSGIHNDDDNDE